MAVNTAMASISRIELPTTIQSAVFIPLQFKSLSSSTAQTVPFMESSRTEAGRVFRMPDKTLPRSQIRKNSEAVLNSDASRYGFVSASKAEQHD
jgi:hypothetical protein